MIKKITDKVVDFMIDHPEGALVLGIVMLVAGQCGIYFLIH